jgi:secondary thiamine-phosphate synthase enzyme
MKIFQKEISLPAFERGFHIITHFVEIEFVEIKGVKQGLLNIFLMHTSAGLTINENADPSVRMDFESHFNKMVPEKLPYFTHTMEGSDDMPAHIKSALLGQSLQIPVVNGRMNLGTWQGIYLCEHRNNGGRRKLTLTLIGN